MRRVRWENSSPRDSRERSASLEVGSHARASAGGGASPACRPTDRMDRHELVDGRRGGDRLRLHRHALGACAGGDRRWSDLRRADEGGCRDRQPLRLPAALHLARDTADALCDRRCVGSGPPSWPSASWPRCGSSAFAIGGCSSSQSFLRSSCRASSSGI